MHILTRKFGVLSQKVRMLFLCYPYTVFSAVLAGALDGGAGIAEDDLGLTLPFDRYAVFRFLIFFCAAALFAETFAWRSRRRKQASLLFGAIFAGAGAYFISLDHDGWLFGISNAVLQRKAQELMLGAVLLLLVLTVYFSFRKTKLTFGNYILKLFFNMLEVLFVYMVLVIGIGLLCAVIETRLLEGISGLVGAVFALLTGCTLVPGMILALQGDGEEPGGSLRFLIRYIICPLTIGRLLLAWIYVLRICMEGELPSNELFSLLSMTFCLGMPVWIMAGYREEENRYQRLLSSLPCVFAPLILIQILAISVRIAVYGLTPDRYAAVMLILFEIGAVLIWYFRRRDLEWMLLLLAVLLIPTFLVPVVNRYRLSILWQQSWLQRYYTEVQNGEQLQVWEYERMNGAYHYLADEVMEESIVRQYDIYGEAFKECLRRQDPMTLELTEYERYYVKGERLTGTLDITDYSSLNLAELDRKRLNDTGLEAVDLSRVPFIIPETGEQMTVDLGPLIRRCMEYIEAHPEAEEAGQHANMKPYCRIELDTGEVLCIDALSFSYKKGIMRGEDYFEWNRFGPIEGILLRK